MSKEILEALRLLDPSDDSHWTAKGLPALDIVGELSGNSELSRDEILAVAPAFTRKNNVLPETVEAPLPSEPAAPVIPDAPTAPVSEATPATVTPEPVAEVEAAPATSLAEFDDAISAKTAEFLAQKTLIETAQQKLKSVQVELDQLIFDKRAAFPPPSPTGNMQAFLEGQLQQRRERSDNAKKLRDLTGVNVSGKSQLDASMERRRGHGLARPTFVPQAQSKG